MLEFGILGPLIVLGDGGEVSMPGARRRTLLLRLLIAGKEPVPGDRLVDDVWEGEPPSGVTPTLQSHLSFLRRTLGAGRIHRNGGGYWLEVGDTELDSRLFESELRDARHSLAHGDAPKAEGLLDRALGRWRGPALAEVAGMAWAVPEATRLEELRLETLEVWLESRLVLGKHNEVAPIAQAAVGEHPLRERLWAQLMLALYRSGRQPEALRAYQRLRHHLGEELGIEPSAELVALDEAIVLQRSDLDWTGASELVTEVGPRLVHPPSGTVTFLFTDIEQSTRKWETRPAEMRVALARHDQLLWSVIESAGGYVFKTVGDAFCAAFSVAVDALAAAVAAQRALSTESWPQGLELRVRMALHSGSCEERDGDYFGPPVNRVARLQATTHGGQVVMSRVTADLVREELPDGVALRDLGEHWLKDLGQPERVFQLDADGLQCDFPPLNSLTNPALQHNLPSQASTFVGRESELADLRTLLNGSRMVTLTGAGGSGKTRLAVQLAMETVDGSADGVWFVELAPLADLGFVAGEVARVLGVVEEPGRPVTETLVDVLRDRSLLVVLDNCEHLINGSAKLADRLLKACPSLRILATSQEPLRIDGESLYRVPSLSLMSSDAATADEAYECEAVQLFVDRATTSDPRFVLTEDNAHKILAVCRRLDGIPLAIELAAARLRSMSLAAIEVRLDDRFRLLTRGSRTALPRHQTLGAMVDWSYDLLNDFEQAVLRRLSVFAGSWSLDAAQAVCADDLESWDVLDLLDSLIDKSLVQVEPTEGESRYRMLETVRQYATEKLDSLSQAEGAAARSAHAKVFLALAEAAARKLLGAQQGAWLTHLEADHDNLRAAITHYLNDPAGAEEALRLGSALRWFWFIRGFFDEGTEFAEAALAHKGAQAPTQLRASVLAAAGDLHYVRGEYGTAQSRLEEGLALARWLEAPALCADLLCRLSSIRRLKGDYRSSAEMADEAVVLARRSTERHELARALLHRAYHSTDASNTAQARSDLEEALSCFTGEGDRRSVAMAFAQLGVIELRAGNAHEAKAHLLGALDIASQLHDNDELPRILLNLGFAALLQGDLVEANKDISGALRVASRTGAQHWITYSLLGLAFCASFIDEDHRAAVLHGAADALLERIGEAHEQIGMDFRAHDHSRLRGVMGEDFEASYASGRCLTQSEAVALALEA